MSVYIKVYFSSVWERKKKKRISWQKQIGKNEKPSTNSLCEERTARPVVCPDLRLQSPHSRLAVDTFQQQLIVVWEGEAKGREHRGQDYPQCKANILWCCVSGQSNTIASTLHQSCSGSNSNVLWYRKEQQKGRRTEKSRSSPRPGKHTVALCGQNNTTASTLHKTVLQWIPSNNNVLCVVCEGAAKRQEDKSTTIKEVKIMNTARQIYCGVVSLGRTTRQHPHYTRSYPYHRLSRKEQATIKSRLGTGTTV